MTLVHVQIDPTSEYEGILTELDELARVHELAHRDQVGERMLGHFFDGKPEYYLDQDPGKEASFGRFVKACKERLTDIGHSTAFLRKSILCHIVVRTLPGELLSELGVSHVLELTRLPDPTARARVGRQAVDEGWPVRRLREVVGLVKAGLWYDNDPVAEGTQPPALPAPEEPKVQPGRLVTQTEKMAEEWGDFVGKWKGIDRKLTKAEQTRVRAAMAQVEKQMAELRKLLR